jgi:hypothetical protein
VLRRGQFESGHSRTGLGGVHGRRNHLEGRGDVSCRGPGTPFAFAGALVCPPRVSILGQVVVCVPPVLGLSSVAERSLPYLPYLTLPYPTSPGRVSRSPVLPYLPYLTLPYPTSPGRVSRSPVLPYLPYLTLPYPTSPGRVSRSPVLPYLPYLTLPYPTSLGRVSRRSAVPCLTLPYPTLPYLTLPFLAAARHGGRVR